MGVVIHLFTYDAIGTPVCGRFGEARCTLTGAESAARAMHTTICPDCLELWARRLRGETVPPAWSERERRKHVGERPSSFATSAPDDYADAALLSVSVHVDRVGLRRALRRALRATHPDRGGEADAFRARADAYARMCHRRGWA